VDSTAWRDIRAGAGAQRRRTGWKVPYPHAVVPMIAIDLAASTPPFEQLRAHLARQIQDRALAVGTRLPPIRQLAADLSLAVNTVARAYRELEEAGLIETRGRAGSFVSAAGEQGRERARRAAADYAAVIASIGIDSDEALRIVEAALTSRTARP
jgi:DNA-binding transcriptional regulator YhcF (GntR family)